MTQQKLVDIMFQIAITSAKHMHGRDNEEIAAWVRDQLAASGFPTVPMGASWGVLIEAPAEPGPDGHPY